MLGIAYTRRKWVPASQGVAPTGADTEVEHPGPAGHFVDVETIPLWIAPDPGGIAPRAASGRFIVQAPDTPVQHSPITNWNPGSPYPGPPATVAKYIDVDSMRWWGRTGQGQTVWSGRAEYSGDLPPMLPQDLLQHLDSWSYYMGGYPNISRNLPPAFGDQTPTLNPVYSGLPEG